MPINLIESPPPVQEDARTLLQIIHPPLTAVSPLNCKLLVSVQNVREAQNAMAGGADWIDVKQPAAGSLGRPTGRAITEVVEQVAGRLPISVALGELRENCRVEDGSLLPLAGVGRVKVGLSGCRSQGAWRENLAQLATALPSHAELVAVQYADWKTCDAPSPAELLEFAREVRCTALLVDTFDKRCGGLFEHFAVAELAQLFLQAHQLEMLCVAAGSLTADKFAAAISAGADVLAVRGAACEGRERTTAISTPQVRLLRDSLANSLAEIS